MATRITSSGRILFGVASLSLLALTGCAAQSAPAPSGTESASASDIPTPEFSQELQDLFPADIIDAGAVRAATITLPPYSYKGEDGRTDIGLTWDAVAALEAATGLQFDVEVTPTISDVYTGFESDRYDLNISPLSDIPATEENYDFANWIAEYVVFLQLKTSDDTIDSLAAACGHTIATLQGGTAQKVLENAQADCAEPIDIALFSDQDSAVLAVKSGRADAAFSSQIPLTYYTQQDDALAISGANSTDNGFPPFWVGSSAPKGSELIEPMLAAYNYLREAGVYDALLKKYGIEANALAEFGINMAGSVQQ